MAEILSEKDYNAKRTKLYNAHVSLYGFKFIEENKQPIIITDSYKEAMTLLKLSKEKLNQHNAIIARKEAALQRQGFINKDGDKCHY